MLCGVVFFALYRVNTVAVSRARNTNNIEINKKNHLNLRRSRSQSHRRSRQKVTRNCREKQVSDKRWNDWGIKSNEYPINGALEQIPFLIECENRWRIRQWNSVHRSIVNGDFRPYRNNQHYFTYFSFAYKCFLFCYCALRMLSCHIINYIETFFVCLFFFVFFCLKIFFAESTTEK